MFHCEIRQALVSEELVCSVGCVCCSVRVEDRLHRANRGLARGRAAWEVEAVDPGSAPGDGLWEKLRSNQAPLSHPHPRSDERR